MMDRCDAIRDDLPLAAGALDPVRARRVEQHLRTCAECRDEASLVALLRTPLPAPAGLEERVRRAVGTAPVRTGTPAWRTVLVAGVAAVAIGGGALLLGRPAGTGSMALDSEAADAAVLGWAARMDPVLHGGIGLDELTDEELELLLTEMQS